MSAPVPHRPPKRASCPKRYRPWTAEDDATLARLYVPRPDWTALAAALPHRTRGAMTMRAAVLELERRQCDWTREEDELLLWAWGVLTPRELKGRLPNRPWRSIQRRARALRPGALPKGLVPLKVAAEKLRYARGTLLGILARHGVPTLRWRGQRGPGKAPKGRHDRRWLLVDLAAATQAVEVELAAANAVETIHGAALRRDLDPGELRRELLKAGAYQVGERGGRRLLPTAVIDAAAARLSGVSQVSGGRPDADGGWR